MIVVNCRFLTQPTTGVQRFAEQIVSALARQRDDLVLVAPPGELRESSIGGVPVTQIGGASGHRWEQLDLPRYLRQNGSPLLVNLMSTAPMGYKNQISTHHDITYVRHPESFSRKFRMLYGVMVPRFLRNSRAVITVSEFSRGELVQHFGLTPESVTVVYNAVDGRFAPLPQRDASATPYFLAVSSPNLHKNFGRMIEAYDRYAAETETNLLIIGAASNSFAQHTYEPTNSGRVTFVGRVDDDELVSLYQQARGFVFPSLYEGFGIPPLEAQQCGTPVIASNAASMPEVLGESVLYCDPFDVNSIADALRRLDQDSALRDDLTARGQLNAGRYSWDASARVVSNLIDSLDSVPA